MPGYTDPTDNDYEISHIHVEHREHVISGAWGKGPGNKTSLPQSWLESGEDIMDTVIEQINCINWHDFRLDAISINYEDAVIYFSSENEQQCTLPSIVSTFAVRLKAS